MRVFSTFQRTLVMRLLILVILAVASGCSSDEIEFSSDVTVGVSYGSNAGISGNVSYVDVADGGALLVADAGSSTRSRSGFASEEVVEVDPAEDGITNALELTLLFGGSEEVDFITSPSWLSSGDASVLDGSRVVALGSGPSSSDEVGVLLAEYNRDLKSWSEIDLAAADVGPLTFQPPVSRVDGDLVLDMTNSYVVLSETPTVLPIQLFGGPLGLRSRVVISSPTGMSSMAAWSNGALRIFELDSGWNLTRQREVSTRDTAFAGSAVPLGIDLAFANGRLFVFALFDEALEIYEMVDDGQRLSRVSTLTSEGSGFARDGFHRLFVREFAERFAAVVTGPGDLMIFDSEDSSFEQVRLDEDVTCHLSGAVGSHSSDNSLLLVAAGGDRCDDRSSVELVVTQADS